MFKWFGVLLALVGLCLCACVDSIDGDSSNINEEQAFAADNPNPPEGEEGSESESNAEQASGEVAAAETSSGGGALSLGGVTWLHSNVGGWPETANLRSVSVRGGSITLNYDKAKSWPGVNHAGANVNANPWIFVNQGGKWYGATWEWMRVGQTTKATSSVKGDHIKKSPLNNFVPRSGETYGFMVSGLARDSKRNVRERSNVVMVRWP